MYVYYCMRNLAHDNSSNQLLGGGGGQLYPAQLFTRACRPVAHLPGPVKCQLYQSMKQLHTQTAGSCSCGPQTRLLFVWITVEC